MKHFLTKKAKDRLKRHNFWRLTQAEISKSKSIFLSVLQNLWHSCDNPKNLFNGNVIAIIDIEVLM